MIESARISWLIGFKDKNKDCMHYISNPWWGWCADPFLIEHEGRTYIFAEIWNYFTQRGAIGYYAIDKNKSKWTKVISEYYHMSYPYIWKDDKGIHICAETCGDRKVGIYDCTDFPNKWAYRGDLIVGEKFADTTFLRDVETGKLQYAFTYVIEGKNKGYLAKYEIVEDLIVADSKTVITSDSAIARPGGDFFIKENILYRVAQDCSSNYGERLNLMAVSQISPYKEELIDRIDFSKFAVDDCIGIHTYNQTSKYEVFDFRIKKTLLANIVGTYFRFCLRSIKHAIKGQFLKNM